MATLTTTSLLEDPPESRRELMDQLVPLVYDELRKMAHRQLQLEAGPRTLNTTGLVHEAYLKLIDESTVPMHNRGYFFGAAARAMRQVMIDAARRRRAAKRGSGEAPLPLDESRVEVDSYAEELLALDQALQRLAGEYPRSAQVVEYRFFGGLSVEQTADLLEVSERTIKRDWRLARAWLQRDLGYVF